MTLLLQTLDKLPAPITETPIMASFKFIAASNRKGPAGSTGGIRSGDLPGSGGAKRNVDGGIKSRHAGVTSSGTQIKSAVGSLAQQATRVASSYAAKGQPRGFAGDKRENKGYVMGTGTTGKGKLPSGSAFGTQNLRVAAEGPTPKGADIDNHPKIYSQKNKSLTMNGMKAKVKGLVGGLSGSFNGRKAIGQTGNGIGGKRKRSFV